VTASIYIYCANNSIAISRRQHGSAVRNLHGESGWIPNSIIIIEVYIFIFIYYPAYNKIESVRAGSWVISYSLKRQKKHFLTYTIK